LASVARGGTLGACSDAPRSIVTSSAPADFQRGLELTRAAQFGAARAALEQAAASGHGDAQAWLGLHALYGYGRAVDAHEALERLLAAEAAGSPEASYQLALFGWADRLVARDPRRMAARLAAAARRDHPGALRAAGLVLADAAARDAALGDAADACFARAAALGDASAYALFAQRCAASPDPARRQRALGVLAAAAAVLPRARRRVPPGTAPIRVQAPAVEVPALDLATPKTWTPQVHHRDPLVETIDRFLSPLECEYLITLGEPHLHRSVTVADDGRLVPHPDRVSSDVALHGGRDDFGSRWLQARMLDWLGVPVAHGEHLILLRYEPGEHYRPHVDYLPPGARGNVAAPDQPGQRVHTVFAYLDGVEAGGQTAFPRLGIQIKPAPGRIVHFTNLAADGAPDPRSLHAGNPVERGTKWLATIWTRERDYRRC
jgi:hypothetical protein